MKLLGITGGIGSGKSEVAKCFLELGAEVIDADSIARQVMEKDGSAYNKVVTCFGEEILMPNGEIDRKKLASLVFSSSEKLQQLNAITHPCVFEEMGKRIKASKAELVCLDVPLLFSSEFPFSCDKTLAVLAPRELKIQRVMQRDGATQEQVKERMACQLPDEVLCEKADLCITNEKSIEELKACVKEIYQNIME